MSLTGRGRKEVPPRIPLPRHPTHVRSDSRIAVPPRPLASYRSATRRVCRAPCLFFFVRGIRDSMELNAAFADRADEQGRAARYIWWVLVGNVRARRNLKSTVIGPINLTTFSFIDSLRSSCSMHQPSQLTA